MHVRLTLPSEKLRLFQCAMLAAALASYRLSRAVRRSTPACNEYYQAFGLTAAPHIVCSHLPSCSEPVATDGKSWTNVIFSPVLKFFGSGWLNWRLR